MHKATKPTARTREVKVTHNLRIALMVHACCIGRRTQRILRANMRMGDVAQMTKAKVRRMFVREDIRSYAAYLKGHGLEFGVKLLGWKPFNPRPRHP